MLTDSKLRSQVDQLWDKFWSGGLTNPLDAIEQFSFLLFFKRLEDEDLQKERSAKRLNKPFISSLPQKIRWSEWTNYPAEKALSYLKDVVFPEFRKMGADGSSFQQYMQNAECKINKPSLLIEACKLIDQMQVSSQNQDVQGDLYEYLLSRLNQAGRNGQFRTPRHIIRMMVQMVAPKAGERIGDLAAGTAGFLVNAYQYILESTTSPEILEYDSEGFPHHLIGDKLPQGKMEFLQSPKAFRGFDNDSGMTMLRIGSMNLILHGIKSPQFFYKDTLSKAFNDEREYDVILMNPPFKGAIDKSDVNPTLPGTETSKTELLFIHLILRALDMGGRCALICPDGILFGASKAHINLRKKLIEENRLEGVISLPGGVFKPYSGVSTGILFFTRGATTDKVWFYDVASDGFSLDDKRTPAPEESDIPDVIECWQKRFDPEFSVKRSSRLDTLRSQISPLDKQRLELESDINKLTFESVVSSPDQSVEAAISLEKSKSILTELHSRLAPLKSERDQFTHQFWVTKDQLKANKYDLSVSRYRQEDQDKVYYEEPSVTLDRISYLDRVSNNEIEEIKRMLKK
jgi:type I restriction enzyme M protein